MSEKFSTTVSKTNLEKISEKKFQTKNLKPNSDKNSENSSVGNNHFCDRHTDRHLNILYISSACGVLHQECSGCSRVIVTGGPNVTRPQATFRLGAASIITILIAIAIKHSSLTGV